MVTGALKNYTDDNIIELIESFKSKEVSYNLSDLKAVLAEVNNRHLEGNYAEVLGELIRDKILNGDVASTPITPPPAKEETVVAPAITEKDLAKDEVVEEESEEPVVDKKPKKEKKEKERVKSVQEKNMNKEDEVVYEEEKYPVLAFSVGLLKVLGWIGMTVCILTSMYDALVNKLIVPAAAIKSIFFGLLAGTIVLLFCYNKAENITLKLDIEDHLNKLREKK